ncbi:alanine--tRNA ligase, cytoplasmic-like [Artemia franciscana]|uniref:Alanyl-transfer RNA synthetases family profile domain-containing protein n=1 Tax=Artemia franciscana TaxID=6661 RepID=A0AA88HGS8_ARTSF|nr:hypothetical protein QYM36_013607 [Artemia franciscana]
MIAYSSISKLFRAGILFAGAGIAIWWVNKKYKESKRDEGSLDDEEMKNEAKPANEEDIIIAPASQEHIQMDHNDYNVRKKHAGFGMDLEQTVSIDQQKRSEEELFTSLFDAIEKGTNMPAYSGKWGAEDTEGIDMAYRIVADTIRCLTIALSDGEILGKTERGYYLQRILRRGVYYATEKLKAKENFFGSLVHVVDLWLIDTLGEEFIKIKRDPERIINLINEEEKLFQAALSHGRSVFEKKVAELGDSKVLPGATAWELKATHGVPFDLTELLCDEKELTIDTIAYEQCQKKAQQLARQRVFF